MAVTGWVAHVLSITYSLGDVNASESLAPLAFHDVAGCRFHARSVAGTVATFPEVQRRVRLSISHAAKTLDVLRQNNSNSRVVQYDRSSFSHIHSKEKEAGK